MMKKRSKKQNKSPLLAVGCAVLLTVVLLLVLGGRSNLDDEIKSGKAYLESLEEKNPDEVRQVRKAIRKAELEAQRDELLDQLAEGTLDPLSIFEDYALMGDSRSVGFEYWNFLDPNRVFANSGDTILSVDEQLGTLTSLNPATIYLCYGLNDMKIGIWPTAEEYAAAYMEVVDAIHAQLPDTTIVISSILPAQDPAFSQSAAWYDIAAWNEVLEEACEEHDVLFANCDEMAQEQLDLWDPDGIHFQAAFYPHWSRCLIETMLSDEIIVTEDT